MTAKKVPLTKDDVRQALKKIEEEKGETLQENMAKQAEDQAEQTVRQPAANSLSKQRIKKLFRMFCVWIEVYKVGLSPGKVEDCSGCLLREIPWNDSKGNRKDLCHAIWQEGILNV